jgi:5-(carboxyamino)imidazole ribonucleotide synthase
MLGGGQLGRMLIQECINLNVSVAVLDPDPNAPCKNLVDEFVQGDFNDYQTVYAFGRNKDLLTIEIEHVNLEALYQLEKESVKIYPQPAVLEIVKDKGLQKQFYADHGIPTAPFYLVNNREEVKKHVNEFPFMQKLRKGGYDGKGVYPLREEKQIAEGFDAPSVLEKFVDFDREISVIVARNEKGEIAHFPMVDMDFNKEANLVEFLFSPSELDPNIQDRAVDIARSIIGKLQMVGLLAVEMFVTKTGEVLVNEIAPRPHNSGHHTIEANRTSQYAQHLRAILGLPLGNTDIIYPAVMVNLLGQPGYEGNAVYEKLNDVLNLPGTYVHLYGKKTTKPFRKMGHVTIVNKNMDQAKRQAQLVRQLLRVISE